MTNPEVGKSVLVEGLAGGAFATNYLEEGAGDPLVRLGVLQNRDVLVKPSPAVTFSVRFRPCLGVHGVSPVTDVTSTTVRGVSLSWSGAAGAQPKSDMA